MTLARRLRFRASLMKVGVDGALGVARDKATSYGYSLTGRKTAPATDFDPFSAEVMLDPYPGYQSLLTGHDVPENVQAIYITSNGFDFLGVPPLMGRGLLPSDGVDGQEPQAVVVLGNKFWRQHFNSNPAVLGQTLLAYAIMKSGLRVGSFVPATYLRQVVAPVGVNPRLKAWMELS